MTVKENDLSLFSIIIPTLNRKERLRVCLNSIIKLDYPRSKFEIIVVDNGSTDGTSEMVSTEFPEIKIVVELRKNSCYARNAGWKKAKGQIIAYTDDDCIVDENWLKILSSSFDNKEIGGIGGPLLLLLGPKSVVRKFRDTPFGDFFQGSEKKLTDYLITANLALKSEVFKTCRFDESLAFTSLEDIDFCRSLKNNNYKLLYVPNAKVYHNIDPKRLTMRYVLRRVFFAGISAYIFENKKSTNISLIRIFFKDTIEGLLLFFTRRRISDFFWLGRSVVAFLSSLYLLLH